MTTHHRNPDLEAAILAAPDDFQNYVVYSDWLSEQGDPRGELIALQRLKKKSESDALLEKHAEHFLGGMRDFLDIITPIEWHMGFIKSARIANTDDRYNDGEGDYDEDLASAIEAFLSHPSSVFLRELTVGILDVEGNDYTSFFAALAQHPKLALRRLYIGDFGSEETELNWSSIGNAGPLWTAAPNLEDLGLRSGGGMSLGTINAPKLKELEVITGELDRNALIPICAATFPALEKLTLQLGRTRFKIEELKGLYDAVQFPALKHLALQNSSITDDIAKSIVDSKVIAQLESLDLTLGTLSDEGAQALIDAKPKIKHLKRLDLSENWLSKSIGSKLNGLCETVFDAGQRGPDEGEPDPDNRYIAAYE